MNPAIRRGHANHVFVDTETLNCLVSRVHPRQLTCPDAIEEAASCRISMAPVLLDELWLLIFAYLVSVHPCLVSISFLQHSISIVDGLKADVCVCVCVSGFY